MCIAPIITPSSFKTHKSKENNCVETSQRVPHTGTKSSRYDLVSQIGRIGALFSRYDCSCLETWIRISRCNVIRRIHFLLYDNKHTTLQFHPGYRCNWTLQSICSSLSPICIELFRQMDMTENINESLDCCTLHNNSISFVITEKSNSYEYPSVSKVLQ